MTEQKCCKLSKNPENCVECPMGMSLRNKMMLTGLSDATEYWNIFWCHNCGEIISRNCPESEKFVEAI